MFVPISINDFLVSYKKTNPNENHQDFKQNLEQTVTAKKDGAECMQCGQPIWAIGTAIVGWNGCFTCITGESDSSEDYEIDRVCF